MFYLPARSAYRRRPLRLAVAPRRQQCGGISAGDDGGAQPVSIIVSHCEEVVNETHSDLGGSLWPGRRYVRGEVPEKGAGQDGAAGRNGRAAVHLIPGGLLATANTMGHWRTSVIRQELQLNCRLAAAETANIGLTGVL